MWLMISDMSRENETNGNQLVNETGKKPQHCEHPGCRVEAEGVEKEVRFYIR